MLNEAALLRQILAGLGLCECLTQTSQDVLGFRVEPSPATEPVNEKCEITESTSTPCKRLHGKVIMPRQ